MSLQDDKRELLKLKQGLIEESETIKEEEKPVYELHGKKKIANFFYHYKWHVIVGAFFAVVIGFFIYNMIAKQRGDIRVLAVTKDSGIAANIYYKTKDLEHAVEQYCPNFDGNGYVHVDVYNIDLSENIRQDYMLGAVTKLTGEIDYGEAMMLIMDTPALESLIPMGNVEFFVDMQKRYPDDPHADGIRYYIKGTAFESFANYEEACPDDLFIVVRSVNESTLNRGRAEKAHDRALTVMDNIVSGKYSGWEFEEGRIYGIDGEG